MDEKSTPSNYFRPSGQNFFGNAEIDFNEYTDFFNEEVDKEFTRNIEKIEEENEKKSERLKKLKSKYYEIFKKYSLFVIGKSISEKIYLTSFGFMIFTIPFFIIQNISNKKIFDFSKIFNGVNLGNIIFLYYIFLIILCISCIIISQKLSKIIEKKEFSLNQLRLKITDELE